MIAQEDIQFRLANAFPDGEVAVTDITGAQDSYQARVISTRFEGKSLFEQHQLVYGALGDALYNAMATFSLKTYSPHAWQRLRHSAR
jgi:stress-induced morphogen